MTIRGLLFDKDGVLVDFDRTWTPALKSMALLLAGGDQGEAERYLQLAGFDLEGDKFLPGSIWAAGNTHDLVAVWDPDGNAQSRKELGGRIEAHCAQMVQAPLLPLEELSELFGVFKDRDLYLGIATNDACSSAERAMQQFGIVNRFDLIMGYDSVVNPKPAADPVHLFCRTCDVVPAEIAMIGDNMHDIEMARAAGAGLAIGVLSGNTTRAEFNGHVDYLIDDVSHLPDILDKIQ